MTTYLSLVLGELVPKRLALIAPERIAGIAATPMNVLSRIAYPAVWLLRASTESLLRLVNLHKTGGTAVTEEEIQAIIEEGATSGAIDAEERVMMRGVMRLADRDVRSIMTPRPDIVWIDTDDAVQVALEKMDKAGHSRFPLARGRLQHVIGILQTKDLLSRVGRRDASDLEDAARKATFVPEWLSVIKLLEALREGETRMALVVDEHGVVLGLVTAADVLGAIAGDTAFSREDALDPPTRRDDGSWLIDGLTAIDDLETLLATSGLGDERDEYSTVAGLVMHGMGRLPAPGDVVTKRGWRIEVVDMDGRRIDKVIIRRADDGISH
jgi:putative hemolysin